MSRRNRGRGPRTPTEVERRVFMAHGWFGLGRLVIMWAGSIGLAWVGIYLPIRASAGKITFIDLIYDLAVKTGLGHKVSLGINLALILLGSGEVTRGAYSTSVDGRSNWNCSLTRGVVPVTQGT